MAKKKTAKRHTNGSGKPRATKQSKKDVAKVLGKGALRTRPRSVPLPGMEDTRISALDDVAESIAEVREQMNDLRQREAEHLRSALNLMREHNKTAWRAAGVEMVRVPGEEKLRVRTSKEKATAETDPEDEVPGDVVAMDAVDEPDAAEEEIEVEVEDAGADV